MFVVDLEDGERLEEARLEMERMVRILGTSTPLMVIANKMDLPGEREASDNLSLNVYSGTISGTCLTHLLGLSASYPGIWKVTECCAVTGEGLESVLAEASKMIKHATRRNSEKFKKKH